MHLVHKITECIVVFIRQFPYIFALGSTVTIEKLTGFSAGQWIPSILWSPKLHYGIHMCPPPVPIPSQLDPFHTVTYQFLNIHLNIIPPIYASVFPVVSFTQVPHPNPVFASSLPIRATCTAHSILLYFITRTILGEQYGSLIPPHYVFFSIPLLPRLS